MFKGTRETAWPWKIPGSNLRYRSADPDSPTTADFDCGSEPWAEEINEFVSSAGWVGKNYTCKAFEFGLDGKSVGFAFALPSKQRHPDYAGTTKEHYQFVIYLGINKQFQGATDLKSGERLSTLIFRAIESLPRDVFDTSGAVIGQMVGLMLEVREQNTRAIRCYERLGFQKDEARGVFESHGMTSIWMRKLFDARQETGAIAPVSVSVGLTGD